MPDWQLRSFFSSFRSLHFTLPSAFRTVLLVVANMHLLRTYGTLSVSLNHFQKGSVFFEQNGAAFQTSFLACSLQWSLCMEGIKQSIRNQKPLRLWIELWGTSLSLFSAGGIHWIVVCLAHLGTGLGSRTQTRPRGHAGGFVGPGPTTGTRHLPNVPQFLWFWQQVGPNHFFFGLSIFGIRV